MMNKRILSLLLAVLTLTSLLFTGCESLFGQGEGTDLEEDIAEEASNSAMTLSMYVVSEEPVSAETAKLVEDAFNKITKAEFKTQVKLHFHTYDEYFTKIEEVVASNIEYENLRKAAADALKKAKKEAKAEGAVTDEAWLDAFYAAHPEYEPFRETEELTGEDTTAAETELVTIAGIDNSYTLSQVKYPEERPHQIDILWIDSYERYTEYIEKEMLMNLDQEINGSSKKLKEYINGELMLWAKWNTDGTYGVPNNVIIGEYTYLMVNKELAEKYSYNPEELTTLAKCAEFLDDVAKYEKDVAPILGEVYPVNTFFWGMDTETGIIDSDTFNILGSPTANRTHDPESKDNVYLQCTNIFKNKDYTDQLEMIQKYKDAGYVVPESATAPEKYAVKIVKGGADLERDYGEYFALNILEYPRASYEDVFTNMFAVSSYTRSDARSMQIITYLNTNKELRNVLQYGVEGVHYKIDEDTGKLVRLNRDYIMDIETTGNVFLAHPEEDMPLDVWEWGKKQNLDAKPYLTMGFDFSKYLPVTDAGDAAEGEEEGEVNTNFVNIADVEIIKQISKEYYDKIQNAKSLEELKQIIEDGKKLDDAKDGDPAVAIKNQKNGREYDAELNPNPGLYSFYMSWLNSKGLITIEDE